MDDEGLEFLNADAGRDAAVTTLPEIACDEVHRGRDGGVSVLMRGGDGRALFTASLTITAKWLVEAASEPPHRSRDEQRRGHHDLQRDHLTD